MSLPVIAGLGFVVAFLMSWLVQPHFRNLGFLTDIVDRPGYRRPHRETVPRTGGMAIFISFFCALFFLENVVLGTPLPWSWLGMLIGSGLAILALGVGDDRFQIHAEKKLYGQLLVIVVLMLFGHRFEFIYLPGIGGIDLGGWAWPFTLFWYLGFINSMNLIDGLDGLASGISIVAALILVVVSIAMGALYSMLFAATLCGATAAFLYWNVSKRKIFLGDSGSMWMGLVLASLILNISEKQHVSMPVLLSPMIIPIWDTGTTIVRRARRRKSIFLADDYHLHHRLLRLGFTPKTAVLCLILVTMGTSLFALSDLLGLAWLGLPAMGVWMWASQLGASRHLENRKKGIDLFSEIFYALGFYDGLDQLDKEPSQNVADIIDLQTERARVERARLKSKGRGSVLNIVKLNGTTDTSSELNSGKSKMMPTPSHEEADDRAVRPTSDDL